MLGMYLLSFLLFLEDKLNKLIIYILDNIINGHWNVDDGKFELFTILIKMLV